MKKCGDGCIACCDFCIHAYHEWIEDNGKYIKGEPIGCIIHYDEWHQKIAQYWESCDDFYCFIQYEKDVNG